MGAAEKFPFVYTDNPDQDKNIVVILSRNPADFEMLAEELKAHSFNNTDHYPGIDPVLYKLV